MLTFAPAAPRSRFGPWLTRLVVVAMVALLGGVAALMLPPSGVSYTIAGDALHVDGHAGWWPESRTVALADITDARRVRLAHGRRTAGTGLPGYCSGRWTFAVDGADEAVRLATTCGADAVRIGVRGEPPTVVSPADPDSFLAAVSARAEGRFDAASPASGPGWIGLTVVGACGLLMGGTALALARRRLWYRVGEGALELPTLLGVRRYALAGATACRAAPSRFALRAAGAAMPGYNVGWFWMWGRIVRVWASRMDSGVRVEHPSGWCVFLTPADEDGFLDALRAEGARGAP